MPTPSFDVNILVEKVCIIRGYLWYLWLMKPVQSLGSDFRFPGLGPPAWIRAWAVCPGLLFYGCGLVSAALSPLSHRVKGRRLFVQWRLG